MRQTESIKPDYRRAYTRRRSRGRAWGWVLLGAFAVYAVGMLSATLDEAPATCGSDAECAELHGPDSQPRED